ncbi:hypothetical protein DRB17_00645 [Ferruginivarius sediminum]|uniref:SSD domain-containing protein n=1 Tax=Ferruginivarius sediminum TaxID=2661937 RepID=A0A369TEJ4_9PROT|nr:hypothetical protein DRB17_00645 [Ferruginivarius sediminum]
MAMPGRQDKPMTGRLSGLCPRFFGAWVRTVQRRRWLVLLAAALLTVLAVVACARLGISTNTVDMISPEVPFRQHAKAYNAAFPQLDNTIVAVVDAPTPEGADHLAAALAQRAVRMPSVREVYLPGGGMLRSHALLYLSQERLAALVKRLAEAEPLLATLSHSPNMQGLADILALAAERGADGEMAGLDRLLREMARTADVGPGAPAAALSWQSLLTPEGSEGVSRTRRFVVLHPKLDFTRLKPAAAAIAAVRTAANDLQADAGAGSRIRLTGEAVIEHQELETVEAGGSRAALLSLFAVSIILLTGFRAPRLAAASLVTLIAGLVWTAGLAAVTVGDLNLISVAFAVLFLGLGIDFCIHFALRYREERRAGTAAALEAAGRGVGCALLLSALCAALGFLSFLPTSYRGLAELGLISALGMFVAVVASLTVLPALLAIWQPRHGRAEPPRLVARERDFVARHGRKVLAVAAVAGLVGLMIAPTLNFDFNPMNLRDPETSSIITFNDLASDVQTSPYAVNVLADDPGAAERIAAEFRAAGGFGSVRTLDSFVPKTQDAKLRMLEDAAFFLAPILARPAEAPSLSPDARADAYRDLIAAASKLGEGEGEVAAAARELRASLLASGESPDLAAIETRWTAYLPDTLNFLTEALSAGPLTRADLPDDLRQRWIGVDGRARVEVRPSAAITGNGDIRRFAERAQSIDSAATGAPIVIQEASKAVVGAFKEATLYALLAIVLLLAVALGRVLDVVLTLAPLALAAVLTVATAALVGIPLNFANVIVLPLLMGLGVSSGIHLVLRARDVARIDEIFTTSTPRAVLLSVLTTLASFGTLMVSDHRGMSSMGALLTIAIAFTLLSVLVVLPCLLAQVKSPRMRGL